MADARERPVAVHRDVEHVDGVVERKLPRAEEAEEPLAAGHAEERCVAYAGGGVSAGCGWQSAGVDAEERGMAQQKLVRRSDK